MAIASAILSLHRDGRQLWKQRKSVRLHSTLENYTRLTHTLLFRGDVYGKRHGRDGVSFSYNGIVYYGLMYCSYGHRFSRFPSSAQLVQVLILERVSLYSGNKLVEKRFLHERFMFSVSNAGHIHTVLVQRADLLQPRMFLIDSFWIKQKFNLRKQLHEIETDQISPLLYTSLNYITTTSSIGQISPQIDLSLHIPSHPCRR